MKSERSPCFWVAEEFHNLVRLGNIFPTLPVYAGVGQLLPTDVVTG